MVPPLPVGFSIDDIRSFAALPDGRGVEAFLASAEASAMPSGLGNVYRGEALENLVRAVMTLTPSVFLPGGAQFSEIASTSRRRLSEPAGGLGSDALWTADQEALERISPGHGRGLHDERRDSSMMDIFATVAPVGRRNHGTLLAVQPSLPI